MSQPNNQNNDTSNLQNKLVQDTIDHTHQTNAQVQQSLQSNSNKQTVLNDQFSDVSSYQKARHKGNKRPVLMLPKPSQIALNPPKILNS